MTRKALLAIAAIGTFFPGAALGDDFPNVELKFPEPTTTQVSGQIPIDVRAWDDIGITSVWFRVDGATVKIWSPSQSGVYTWTWNADALSNGPHTIQVFARDSANQTMATPPLTVASNNSGLAVARSNVTQS